MNFDLKKIGLFFVVFTAVLVFLYKVSDYSENNNVQIILADTTCVSLDTICIEHDTLK